MFRLLLVLSFLPASPLAADRRAIVSAHEAFPMQSVFKLPIALEVLRQVDTRNLVLDQLVVLDAADARPGMADTIAVPSQHTVGELLAAMLINSDNVACDKLLALVVPRWSMRV